MDTTRTDDRARAGFTLIEMLIVIGIIAVLAAALMPALVEGGNAAKETNTKALFRRIEVACDSFERANHYYPPDDFVDPQGKLTFKSDNGINSGIESLVAFLSQVKATGADLSDLGPQLSNTDSDDNGALLPVLGRKERLEIADAWGTPLAYFSRTSKNGGFSKPQKIIGADGLTQTVTARKNAEGLPLGKNKFQVLSAGQDMIFGTADDLSWPEKPEN
jgi:prepilin-type N-terminal cleavage/methylation domain-containing protein